MQWMKTTALGLSMIAAAMVSTLGGCACNNACCANDKCCEAVGRETTPATQSAFDRLKTLQGDWTTVQEGKPVLVAQFRVTSNGSVVRETMLPGSDHEMTNMYSINGDTILVTHYCALGNQPHMCCCNYSDPSTFAFVYTGCSNLPNPQAMHMADMTLTIKDSDHIQEKWANVAEGGDKVTHAVFELTRKN